MKRRLFIAGLPLVGGCGGEHAIVAGSKNFTEQVVLGEIVAQHLETRLHRRVDRKLNLGGTLLAHQALVSGQIDVYPEYTGTALTAILKLPPGGEPAAVLEKVRQEYRRRWQLEWLPPLGFNNTFAMVIRGEDARRGNVRTLSDAARRPAAWRLGAGYEFVQRADGLNGLQALYHLPLQGDPVTMDLGLLYRALADRRVDMVAANATDGLLSVLDVQVLRDDRGYFPPYQAALVLRAEHAARMRAPLGELSGLFSDAAMRRLNYEVDGKHRPTAEVAREFLANPGRYRASGAAPNRDSL